MRTRVKAKKSAGAVVASALDFEGHSFPPVLTSKAVVDGLMPPLGTSALPPSLEAAIPVEFRYWLAPTEEEARDVRDELVERDVIKASDVLMVDGVLRRVVWRAFLAEEEDNAVPLVKRSQAGVAGAMCIEGAGSKVVFDAFTESCESIEWSTEQVAKMVGDGGVPCCFALPDTARNRTALSELASTFVLKTRPGVVYGSTHPIDSSASHALVVSPTLKHVVRLLRKAEGEERYVFGIVLEPDVIDSQNDIYSAAEVRKAAHRFMEMHAQLGQQHETIVTGKLKILESYVAPVDFGTGAELVKAGTWLLAIRVVDDGLWEMVKAGSFTGFSIGGSAIRSPDPTVEATPTD